MTVSGKGNSRHWASDCIGCVDTIQASICPSIYRIDTNIITHPYREHMSDRIIGRGGRNSAQGSQDDLVLIVEGHMGRVMMDGGDGRKM